MFTRFKPLFFLCLAMVFLISTFTYPAKAAESTTGLEPLVRVALIKGADSIQSTSSENYRLVNLDDEEVIDISHPGDKWQFENANNMLRVIKNGVYIGCFKGPLAFKETSHVLHILSGNTGSAVEKKYSTDGLTVCSSGGKVAKINKAQEVFIQDSAGVHKLKSPEKVNYFSLGLQEQQKYRGNMLLYLEDEGITLVNELPVENYLCGVIPCEMPAEWPVEALKAQAVASRSYLMAQMAKNKKNIYDVFASEQNQVYGGYSVENEVTNKAVHDTAGEVLVSRGNYVQAFFHSSSGGYIEASSEVWFEQLPYIRPKEDPYDYNEKHYGWITYYTNEQLTKQVNLKLEELDYGVKFAVITDINALDYTATGARIKKMSFTGVDSSGLPLYFEIDVADRVRVLLGLKSACFTFNKEFDNNNRLTAVVFKGNGFGHGLGMSQYGARGMALKGNNYREILQYYYYEVQLVSNYAINKGYTGESF